MRYNKLRLYYTVVTLNVFLDWPILVTSSSQVVYKTWIFLSEPEADYTLHQHTTNPVVSGGKLVCSTDDHW